MRGYAVLLVFLVHQHTLFSDRLDPKSVLYSLMQFAHHVGNSGVDMFFVLSGFLIYGHVLRRSPSYASFLRKRVRRIYPTFLCVFGIYVLLSHLIPSTAKVQQAGFQEIVYLVKNLLFLPGIFDIEPLVTVSWSLSFEFFFYLSIPLFVSGLRMREWKRSHRVSFFFALLAVHSFGYALRLLPHIRLITFVGGILLYEAYEADNLTHLFSKSREIFAVIAYGSIFLIPKSLHDISVYWSILLSACLFSITLFTIGFAGILRAIFNSRPMRWVGNMSYSFFLLHGLVLQGVASLLLQFRSDVHFTPLSYCVVLLFNLVLALTASFVLFTFVEKPLSFETSRPVNAMAKTVAAGNHLA
jgi:peptidoglycan/LPS O-acetylase OafA/YrhL